MENLVIAKAGALFGKEKFWLLSLLSLCFCLFLSACASSNVSRNTESNIDLGMQNARNLSGGASNSNISDSYQNSTQATKGALIGGTVGGVTGSLVQGVGFLPGLGIGAIFGAAYGSYIDANTTLEDRLVNRGATMVVLGDQILIAIPSARIFDDATPNIKPSAYSTLDMVSRYVNNYTKMLVKVSVYTADTGSPSLDLALSQQQANSVAKYLLASGIDARVLYASGYGGSHLVTKNTGDWDSDNYRVEITLEKLYV